MAFYSYIFSANYRRFFGKLKEVSKKENKNYLGLILDTGWCVFRHGLALSDYLNYKIYNRTGAERKRYAGVRAQNSFYERVSPSAYKTRFTVKPTFLKEFAAYTKRDFIVPAEDNYDQFLTFLQTHDTFMSKPYDGLGGMGVEKVDCKTVTDPKAYFEHCIRNRIFLEELVTQHPQMNVLCPTSVNTMRVMTFNDHGKSRILWMGLRVGNGVNPVDNFHAQGMGVAIDMETGKLTGNAIDKDNVEFTHHPTTGVQFDGFQLPCFEEVKDLVLRAALESDKILVVGWDVALSDKGPVIIEGNRRPGFDLVQVLADRGRIDIMEDVLSSLEQK
jgi:hypothetical protein